MSEAPGRAGCDLTAEGMTAWINDYFAACGSGESSDKALGVALGIQLRE